MKVLFTVAMIFAILWGIYSGAMAISSYFELSSVVEEVVSRELPRLLADKGWRPADREQKIRAAILKGATEAGVELDPDGVLVSEEDGALWVRINSGYPLVRYQGQRLFSIPISTAHSFSMSR